MARIIRGISLAAVMSVSLLAAACPFGGAESGVNVKKQAVAAVEAFYKYHISHDGFYVQEYRRSKAVADPETYESASRRVRQAGQAG